MKTFQDLGFLGFVYFAYDCACACVSYVMDELSKNLVRVDVVLSQSRRLALAIDVMMLSCLASLLMAAAFGCVVLICHAHQQGQQHEHEHEREEVLKR